MNPQETQELTDFIHKIRDEYDLSILMIEHHMDLVMRISDRITSWTSASRSPRHTGGGPERSSGHRGIFGGGRRC